MWPVHLLYIQRHFALPHPLFVWQEFEYHSPQQWRLYNSEIFYNKGFKSTELLMNFCDNHENVKKSINKLLFSKTMDFTNCFISSTKHARKLVITCNKLMFCNNFENYYKGITRMKLATYSQITFTSSSTGLTPFPRSRKSFNQPSTLSCTLDDAEFSSSDGLNSTSDPVSSSRIISIGKSSESWEIKSHKCKAFFSKHEPDVHNLNPGQNGCGQKTMTRCCRSHLEVHVFLSFWKSIGSLLMKWYMKHIFYWTVTANKLWSLQLWTQFLQLRMEAWKIQDFNRIWTYDLTIPV